MLQPAGITTSRADPHAVEGQHRHFGYWIDRDWGRARCYGCGFQFAGTDDTAEEWRPAGTTTPTRHRVGVVVVKPVGAVPVW